MTNSMTNSQTQATWTYHNGTKHPGGLLFDPYHHYDWESRPLLFKRYLDLQSQPITVPDTPVGMPALQAIAQSTAEGRAWAEPERAEVARLLQLSAGITKTIDYGPQVGEIPFRAAACTGALYHIELYAVCGDLPGLEAGVYHFDVEGPGLSQLRRGDYRRLLVAASGDASGMAEAPLILLYSDIYWRNAVKYQARAYRHAFWDSGTILANTLALAAAMGLPAQVVTGFVDETVNGLLDLDTQREFVLFMLALGQVESEPPAAPQVTPLNLAVEPLQGERLLPAILEMHQASSLESVDEVRAWRGDDFAVSLPAPQGETVRLQPLSAEKQPDDDLATVIVRRGSSRRFQEEPISFVQLSTMLQQAFSGLPADFRKADAPVALNTVYLIANAVEGLTSGRYVYHPQAQQLELLQEGYFRAEAGALALGQALGADAAANIYFLAELPALLERFGNRGYRIAQLEASTIAGRIYLAAYALGLGASGLTFYDNDVTRFFSPHAEGKSAMFLVTVVVAGRR